MTTPTIDLREVKTSEGQDLHSLSYDGPVLVVFLRQFGCVFCQEALRDLRSIKTELDNRGVRLCLVHMGSVDQGETHLQNNGLTSVVHISDPLCRLYYSFGLDKGKVRQLLGLRTWLRTAEAVATGSKVSSEQVGDGSQMPGVFLLRDGEVKKEFVHKRASDRPDYMALIT